MDGKILDYINSLDMHDAEIFFMWVCNFLGDFSQIFYFFLVTLNVIQID